MIEKQYSLVADIGGTNARFALVADNDSRPLEPRNLPCANYPTIVEATQDYLKQVAPLLPYQAAMSVASPVTGDQITMTNHNWCFSINGTREALGLRQLKVFNDYTALALALPFLSDSQYLQVGGGEALSEYPKAVLGPGTGLGVSAAIPAGNHWAPLEGEGGHVSYGPLSDRESQIIHILREQYSHISAESLVSGRGLSLLYQSLMQIESGEAKNLIPAEISALALNDNDSLACEALDIFCGILGTVAGNLALTVGARGGVFIGGGIVLKILEFFMQSSFRQRFEQHGRFTSYLQNIPTFIINTDYPALGGAVVALGSAYASVGVVSLDQNE